MRSHASWADVEEWIQILAQKISESGETFTDLYAFPRGGLVPAVMLSHRLNIRYSTIITSACLLVDDIADSGKTLKMYSHKKATCLWRTTSDVKPDFYGIAIEHSDYIIFPWEV